MTDTSKLLDVLERRLGGRRVLRTAWVIEAGSAQAVYDSLVYYCPFDDGLLVLPFTRTARVERNLRNAATVSNEVATVRGDRRARGRSDYAGLNLPAQDSACVRLPRPGSNRRPCESHAWAHDPAEAGGWDPSSAPALWTPIGPPGMSRREEVQAV
jgi:hypothetical protein